MHSATFGRQMEENIAFFATLLGDPAISATFLEAAEIRRKAIGRMLWSGEMGQWVDYCLPQNGPGEVVVLDLDRDIN